MTQVEPSWPKWAQDGPKWPPGGPSWTQVGPKLSPSWPKLAPSCLKLAQVGPKLAPSWPKLTPSWPQVGPKLAQDEPMERKCRKLKNIEKPLVFVGFLSLWGSKLGPCRGQDGSVEVILASCWPKLGPRWGMLSELEPR